MDTVYGLYKVKKFLNEATLLWAAHPEYRSNGTIKVVYHDVEDVKDINKVEKEVNEFFTADGNGKTIGEEINEIINWLKEYKKECDDTRSHFDRWYRDEDFGVTSMFFILMEKF